MFRIEILILTIVFLLVSVLSYRPNVSLLRSRYGITTRKMTRETNFETSTFTVGSDVPPEIAKHVCIHDMILVERYSSPRTTASGLIVSATEGKEKKQLGKVLSIPNYGIESAQGKLTPINDIAPYKVGDQVFVKQPWGRSILELRSGPRFFSFHTASQVLALINRSDTNNDSSSCNT